MRTSRKITSRTSRPVAANPGTKVASLPIGARVVRVLDGKVVTRGKVVGHKQSPDNRGRLKSAVSILEDGSDHPYTYLDGEGIALEKNGTGLSLASAMWANGKRRVSHRGGSDMRRIEQAARESGWTVDRTKSGHLVFRSPDKSVPPVYSGSDIGDPHSLKNIESVLRRHGLETRPGRKIERNPQMKRKAVVTIEFDVTIPTRRGDDEEWIASDVEDEILDLTESAAVQLYDKLGSTRAGHPHVHVELKPALPAKKRTSRR